MANFAELPSEILDSIVFGGLDEWAEEMELTRVPPLHYARKLDDELRWIANLTQVNRRLRRHFLARLWHRVDLFHVKDLYLVDKFLATRQASVYGPLIQHLVFSWGDVDRADGLCGEVYMDEHNQDHGLFGKKQDWLFQDRRALLIRTEVAEDRENYPDMTDDELFEFQWSSAEDSEWRITKGPDGWGDVPGYSSPKDVAAGLVRVSSCAGNVHMLDYNERYIPVPPSFLSNLGKLDKITLYSDNNHQDNRDSALDELPKSVQHMDIMYIFRAGPPERSGKRRRAAPFLSLQREGLGLAYKDVKDDDVDEPERRLRLTCAAIIKGLTQGSLRSVKLWDHELLRVAEMLPCWLALDLQTDDEAGDAVPGWAFEVRNVLSLSGQETNAVFEAVVELKRILAGCGSGKEVQKRSWEKAEAAPSNDGILDAATLASWLADDEALSHAVYQGMQWATMRP